MTKEEFFLEIVGSIKELDAPEPPKKGTGSPCLCLGLLRKLSLPFSTRRLTILSCLSAFLFIEGNTVFYGLLFYVRAIRGNAYINNVLHAATEVPAIFISGLLFRLCNQRKPPVFCMVVINLAVLTVGGGYYTFGSPSEDTLLNVCCMLGLIIGAAVNNMSLIYIPELYPSEIRAQGMGFAVGLGRLGGVLCPFINALDSGLGHGSSLLIYGAVAILQLLNIACLPNTTGRDLRDNISSTDSSSDEKSHNGSSVSFGDSVLQTNAGGDVVQVYDD